MPFRLALQQLSGLQNGGVLAGMLLVAAAGTLAARMPGWSALGSLRGWAVGGCMASALALFALALAGLQPDVWPLAPTVFALGAANGAFSIGAIGSMMRLAGDGHAAREGVRMGLWGAAQAMAFGLGGIVGTAASDIARWLIGEPGPAYGAVFALEGLLFLASAALAWRLGATGSVRRAAEPAADTRHAPPRFATDAK